jgi:hypothetical protein
MLLAATLRKSISRRSKSEPVGNVSAKECRGERKCLTIKLADPAKPRFRWGPSRGAPGNVAVGKTACSIQGREAQDDAS